MFENFDMAANLANFETALTQIVAPGYLGIFVVMLCLIGIIAILNKTMGS